MMKGVILAGGSGTRLRPLTHIFNKHLLPVGARPMIHYAVDKLKQAGIEHIMLVTSKAAMPLMAEYLGGGGEHGVKLTYAIQEQAGGVAHALGVAEGFIAPDEKFVVLLGDNLFEDSLGEYVREFASVSEGAMVFLKRVEDPRRYGVPVMRNGRIERIEEKPEKPQSSYCATGIYMYGAEVFPIIRTLKPSGRGELEITDVNNVYAGRGSLHHRELAGWWIDAGTFPSWYEAFDRLRGSGQNG